MSPPSIIRRTRTDSSEDEDLFASSTEDKSNESDFDSDISDGEYMLLFLAFSGLHLSKSYGSFLILYFR